MVEKSDAIDEDELMMLALDAGAEDMEVAEDGYTIITAPEDFAAVMDAMGENDIEVLTGEVAMIPSTETAF